MVFTPLNSTEVLPGKPTKSELFTKTKDNFNDHESRIADTEAATVNTVPFEMGIAGQPQVGDGMDYFRVPFPITVTGVKLVVWEAGTASTLSVDVQRKSGVGAFATILTGNVTAAFSAGDLSVSSAPGLSITSLAAGDFLRIDVDSVQHLMRGFTILVEYTVSA